MNSFIKLSLVVFAVALVACSAAGDRYESIIRTPSENSIGSTTSENSNSNVSSQTLSASNLLTENKVFRIPSEFSTLQRALDEARKYQPHTFTISVVIETGHQITDGAILNQTDLSFVEIQCEDAIAKISATFPDNKDILFGSGTRMPTLNCLFDMEGRSGSGVRAVVGSQIQIRAGAGVKNAGKWGLLVDHGSSAYAANSIWTGASSGGIFANTSVVSAIDADVSDSDIGVYAGSGASVNFRGGKARNTRIGLSANLSSEIDATYRGTPGTETHRKTDVSNASEYGIFARNLARVVFIYGIASNCNRAILAHNGASVQATSSEFSGNTLYDLAVTGGATIIAHGTNANKLSSSSTAHNALEPNQFTSSGVIFK